MIFFFVMALVLPVLFGFLLLKAMRFRSSWLSVAFLSFFLGLGIIALWMLFLLIINQPLTFYSVSLPLILFFLILQWLLLKNDSPICSWPSLLPFSLNLSRRIFLYGAVFFISYQMYFAFRTASLAPIYTWDGIYAIAIKAKYFFFGGNLAGLKNFPLTSSYPIQMELDLAWLALVLNHWDDQMLKYVFPVFLSAYLALQYDFVKEFASRSQALLSVVLTVCSYFVVYHATVEYRSIYFLAYNLIPVFLIFRSFKKNETAALFLAGIFSGLSAFVKLEGSGHFLIYILLILYMTLDSEKRSLKAGWLWQVRFMGPALFVALPFWLVKKAYHFGSFEGRLDLQGGEFINRLGPVLLTTLQNMFLSGNWSILWFVLLVFILTAKKESFRPPVVQYIAVSLVLYFSLYVGLGLFTATYAVLFYDPEINLSRALLHFFPLCPILIALLHERKD